VTAGMLDKAAQGRRNLRNGKTAMRQLATWLREHGAPHADLVSRHHASDIVGVGDAAIECTVAEWKAMPVKDAQAARDCHERGLSRYVVVKKRVASPGERAKDPGDWWAVMPFRLWWFRELEVTRLEAKVGHLQEENARLNVELHGRPVRNVAEGL